MRRVARAMAGGLWWLGAAAGWAQVRPVDQLQHDARGLQLLWSDGRPDEAALLAQPFIHGGQVTLQWAAIEKEPGVFDFSALDAKLAWFAERGKWATVQVNGNHKPAWLFAQVPHVPRRLHQQVQDAGGTLMFWHPKFQAAHLAMLHALADHLRAHPRRSRLLGLRMNFNAIGTEQLEVPPELRRADAWTPPPAAGPDPVPDYSEAVRTAYIARVVAAYRAEFEPWTLVFVRNLVDGDLLRQLEPDLRAGRVGLFHTSSEVEPRTAATERRYGLFYDYARRGDTVAYAEPWASAWGEHGGKLDVRWCSPCQWNYWTLLFNLHCGVSFIGEYYSNLHFALTGEHPGRGPRTVKPAEQAAEFRAAYAWADRYAGRHNHPEESPGAWVAFRANPEIKARNNAAPPAAWALKRFAGDYTFLMQRVDGDGSTGVGPVGPPEQRYGAFARRFAPRAVAKLKLDERFLRSLARGAIVRVIYLDEARASDASVRAVSAPGTVRLGRLDFHGTGRWVAVDLPWPEARAAAGTGHQLEVAAGGAPVVLHLIEVSRR